MTTPKPNSITLSSLDIRTSGDWYCAKDVYRELGINWSGSTIKRLPKAWRKLMPVDTPKGARDAVFINTKAVACLVNKSRKPIAMSIAIDGVPLVF